MKIPETLLLQTGLAKEFAVKELKIQEALAALSNAFLEENVSYAFFGGTALNQFHLKAKRFSEDLDFFTYGQTPQKFTGLLKLRLTGFHVQGPTRIFRDFHRWKLEYADEENGIAQDWLFVDANFGFPKPPTRTVALQPKSLLNDYGFFIQTPALRSFAVEVFAAQKLVAVQARREGKDFYDLFGLLSQYPLTKRQVLPHARVYATSLFDFARFDEKTFLETARTSVLEATPKELAAADSFIPLANRPNWLQLKKELAMLIGKVR